MIGGGRDGERPIHLRSLRNGSASGLDGAAMRDALGGELPAELQGLPAELRDGGVVGVGPVEVTTGRG